MIEKTIIITGASGKVGNAILKDLSGKDYKIIATYKSNKIKLKSKNIIIKKLDQSKELDISNLIKFISKKKLNLIGIINCGVLRPMKKGSKDNIKNWTKSILVNSNSSYLINKKFGDYFYNKKFGRIVHIGSIYSVVGPDFNLYKNENFELEPDYLYNKFGMVGLVKYFASKYGDKNVTVNIVSPGELNPINLTAL